MVNRCLLKLIFQKQIIHLKFKKTYILKHVLKIKFCNVLLQLKRSEFMSTAVLTTNKVSQPSGPMQVYAVNKCPCVYTIREPNDLVIITKSPAAVKL